MKNLLFALALVVVGTASLWLWHPEKRLFPVPCYERAWDLPTDKEISNCFKHTRRWAFQGLTLSFQREDHVCQSYVIRKMEIYYELGSCLGDKDGWFHRLGEKPQWLIYHWDKYYPDVKGYDK